RDGANVSTPDHTNSRSDPRWVRITLVTAALGVVGVLIVIPLVDVFVEAFGRGFGASWRTLTADEDTLAASPLTMTLAPIAVVTNLIFGIAAAWAISRFRFPGRTLLTALIDLPFSVSPVVAGLIFVLIFGLQGSLGRWLRAHDWGLLLGAPGRVLATPRVRFPSDARARWPRCSRRSRW